MLFKKSKNIITKEFISKTTYKFSNFFDNA